MLDATAIRTTIPNMGMGSMTRLNIDAVLVDEAAWQAVREVELRVVGKCSVRP